VDYYSPKEWTLYLIRLGITWFSYSLRTASAAIAQQISTALKETDIFILISDDGETDTYIELGIAIAHQLNNSKPQIYIIGNRRSLMHCHLSIIPANSIDDILKTLEFQSNR